MKSYFLAHGSPMNAIIDNSYSNFLRDLGRNFSSNSITNSIESNSDSMQNLNIDSIKDSIPLLPKCIIVFSAHWQTNGTFITAAENLEQIYDFYGFPDELYSLKYSPKAAPKLAEQICAKIPQIKPDFSRGLDHGTWCVLCRIFPSANIPVLQISLDKNLDFQEHFKLAKDILNLNLNDVLFIGSGNLIHNLYIMDYEENSSFEWAEICEDYLAKSIENNEINQIINPQDFIPYFHYAAPSIEHYLPAIYILAMQNKNKPKIEFKGIQNGSISMLSFSVE